MGCHLIVGGIRKIVGIASSTAKDLSSLIFNRLFILKSFCRSIVGGSLNEIVQAIKKGMNSDSICTKLLHVCMKAKTVQGTSYDNCTSDHLSMMANDFANLAKIGED